MVISKSICKRLISNYYREVNEVTVAVVFLLHTSLSVRCGINLINLEFLKFLLTAELESFHNHILMYASKRFSFSLPVYAAQTMLAGLDYNHHIHRPAKRKANGSIKVDICDYTSNNHIKSNVNVCTHPHLARSRGVSLNEQTSSRTARPLSLQALALGQDILLQRSPLGDEGSSYNPDVNAEPGL
ncbi:uncharacterized protein LOC127935809 [Scomber scombrus]|uniref:Uncharacterized protein LOC127935809 n=1 Tax=Scomber scombrus TaxID=13677 RepID=A0AAV1P5X1_SCOSC